MSKVDSLVVWRVFQAVHGAVKGISEADGFNTTPAVVTGYNEFSSSSAEAVLYLELESNTADDHDVGGGGTGPRVSMRATFRLIGVVKYGYEFPRKAALALEQDARNAIHDGLQGIRDLVGRGFYFRWGECDHDAGYLAPDREAGFSLRFSFTYRVSSSW